MARVSEWLDGALKRISPRRAMRAKFARIYATNGFQGAESLSGPGSDLAQTRTLVSELPKLLRSIGVRTLLDVPCGDFHWMKLVNLDGVEYLGGDIVRPLIEENRRRHGAAACRFEVIDLAHDRLPRVDLLLCRDCLVHMAYADIFRALRNAVASGTTHILTTTFVDPPGERGLRDRLVATAQPRKAAVQLPGAAARLERELHGE